MVLNAEIPTFLKRFWPEILASPGSYEHRKGPKGTEKKPKRTKKDTKKNQKDTEKD